MSFAALGDCPCLQCGERYRAAVDVKRASNGIILPTGTGIVEELIPPPQPVRQRQDEVNHKMKTVGMGPVLR
jgi:hypothetical protein